VIYVPGNHDEPLREYVGTAFGDIRVVRDCVHVAADGRRYLVLHGDAFDQVTKYHRWLALLGDRAYDLLVSLNVVLSCLRHRLGLTGYRSLAGYAKRKVKSALSFIFDFEDAVVHYARERGFDGVVCGHIHAAALKEVDGVTYVNCGDWVDSCTAVVEHSDGRLEIVGRRTPAAVAQLERGPGAGADAMRETVLEGLQQFCNDLPRTIARPAKLSASESRTWRQKLPSDL
jgi:UDP-2,3-diacylglucosamine pyrophosphatase LpxH